MRSMLIFKSYVWLQLEHREPERDTHSFVEALKRQ